MNSKYELGSLNIYNNKKQNTLFNYFNQTYMKNTIVIFQYSVNFNLAK